MFLRLHKSEIVFGGSVCSLFLFQKMCNLYFQMKDMKEEDDDDDDDDAIGVGMTRGMLDHSRMALCLFMLAVVTFNPFGVVLKRYTDPISGDYSATLLDGRTLKRVESSTERS